MIHGDIFETYNRGHNILELVDILTNFSFATTQMERDYEKKIVYMSCLTIYRIT